MSWQTRGRTYHNWEAYNRARESDQRREQERLVAAIRSPPPMEQSSVERAARLRALAERLDVELDRQAEVLSEAEAGAGSTSAAVESARVERRASAEAMARALREADADASRSLRGLDEAVSEDEQVARAKIATLAAARQADAESVEDARRQLLGEAAVRVRSLPRELAALGLSDAHAKALIASAEAMRGAPGQAMAGQAANEALRVAMEAERRGALLAARRAVLDDELRDLAALLDLPSGALKLVVGPGVDRVGPPLAQVAALRQRVAAIRAWDSHAHLLDTIADDAEPIREEVTALRTLVDNFKTLEARRVELATKALPERLGVPLGGILTIERIVEPPVRVGPVEVRYRTPGGQRLDATLHLDGGFSIHHHDDPSEAHCQEVRRKLATHVEAIADTSAAATKVSPKRSSRAERRARREQTR